MYTLHLNSGEGPLQLVCFDLVYGGCFNGNILDISNFGRDVELISIFADNEEFLNLSDIISNEIQH